MGKPNRRIRFFERVAGHNEDNVVNGFLLRTSMYSTFVQGVSFK